MWLRHSVPNDNCNASFLIIAVASCTCSSLRATLPSYCPVRPQEARRYQVQPQVQQQDVTEPVRGPEHDRVLLVHVRLLALCLWHTQQEAPGQPRLRYKHTPVAALVSLTGRLFDYHILDMIEFGVKSYTSIEDIHAQNLSQQGNKPMFIISGTDARLELQ